MQDIIKYNIGNCTLKVMANSMNGALPFAQYNTYSSQCGIYTTVIGRWSPTTASCIITSLGLGIIYIKTDSVMICLLYLTTAYNNTDQLRIRFVPSLDSYIDKVQYKTCDHVNEWVSGILCNFRG